MNELEKILTGPEKLSGVSRNGPQVITVLKCVVVYLQVVERQFVIPAMFKEVYAKVTVRNIRLC